jgi:hypothetical protein
VVAHYYDNYTCICKIVRGDKIFINSVMIAGCCSARRVLANKALQLVEPLLHSQDAPDGIPPGFLNDFVARFENDGLPEVCAGWLGVSCSISAARCGVPILQCNPPVYTGRHRRGE